jgi:dTDP-3-amino-3,4,6-trideoxy-alpha-D-glucose transaminase
VLDSNITQVRANDFAAQWEEIGTDALDAVARVGRSGWVVLGEEVAAFEAELAAWWGVPHAVGVASGLDALEIALRCCGIGPGDHVLTTPLTAFATTLAIVRAGATPVWSDVDESGSLDLELAAAALESVPGIGALLPVHLYGHPLDPAALASLAEHFGVVVIEDCAQSAGARRDDRPTGAAGRAAATSLYPTKNLGALGDGGVLLTADEGVAEAARSLRNYGQQGQYEHVRLGLNSRLDELHAAILRSAMLPRLDGWLRRRAEIADRYEQALAGSRLEPVRPLGGTSANHLFPVFVAEHDAAAVRAELAAAGVAAGRHYPALCPDQPAAAGAGVTAGELPVARRLAERELSLPVHPQLSDAEVTRVIDVCLEVAA